MYAVSLNAVGCLPDSDFYPVEFDTLTEAWDFVASEVELFEDDGDYLASHTALRDIDRSEPGAIPAGEGIYVFDVFVTEGN